MYYDLCFTMLNPQFNHEMSASWVKSPMPLLTHDNVYCGCFFE